MNRRERVIASLRHQEPDRIPIDLGGMDSTGITAIAYNQLKRRLGLKSGRTRIYDPFQQVVKVESEVLNSIGADVLPVIIEPKQWKAAQLPDGSPCEVPALWNPVTDDHGNQVLKDEHGIIRAVMPKGSLYFDPVNPPLAEVTSIKDIERDLQFIEQFDQASYCDETFADTGRRAKHLYETTDFALFGNFAVHVFAAGQLLRGFEQFMVDLISDPAMAQCIMEHLADTFIRRFDRYHAAIGPYIQIVNVNDDLGTQNGPQLSPELYRKMVKPYQKKVYQHIKQHSKLFLFLHSDGSIYDLIPDIIEMGVDILNPVQFTCRDMELKRLKNEFGRHLTFWGGGCDTQTILPSATPRQIKDHVASCIQVLAPGGGFVFNQLHNIQPDVPPENMLAMYEAVREWNGYAG